MESYGIELTVKQRVNIDRFKAMRWEGRFKKLKRQMISSKYGPTSHTFVDAFVKKRSMLFDKRLK